MLKWSLKYRVSLTTKNWSYLYKKTTLLLTRQVYKYVQTGRLGALELTVEMNYTNMKSMKVEKLCLQKTTYGRTTKVSSVSYQRNKSTKNQKKSPLKYMV